MHATVKWAEGLQFIGESGSGHPVVLDSPDNNKGISPMEMLLLGVGECSAFDVIMILEKPRQKMLDCRWKWMENVLKNPRGCSQK